MSPLRKTEEAASAASGDAASPTLPASDGDAALALFAARARLEDAPVLLVLLLGLSGIAWVTLGQMAALCWAGAMLASLVPVLAVARHVLRRGPAPQLTRAADALYGLAQISTALLVLWPGATPDLGGPLFAMALIGMAVNVVTCRHTRFAVLVGVLPLGLAASTALYLLDGFALPLLPIVVFGAMLALVRLGLDLAERERARTLQLLAAEAQARADQQARVESELQRWEADRSNQAKSHFLATMSHELRTPLNAILGFAEVLKGELLGRHQVPQYRDYADDIHRSGQHLLKLINELLDLSRIEAGRYELSEEPLYLADLAEDCRRMMDIRARSKNLTLTFRLDDLPQLLGDERAIRQVLINLTTNAVKFTPAGGRVEVRLSASADGGQLIAVRDTGPGLAPEELEAIREARRLGSIAERRPEQGAGLGLSIVRQIMALHQGRFDLFSRLGVGTEAIVTFPRRRVIEGSAPPMKRAG